MIFHLLFYGILWIKSGSKKYFDNATRVGGGGGEEEAAGRENYKSCDNDSLGINNQGLFKDSYTSKPNSLLYLIYIMNPDEIEIFCCIINTAFLLVMFFMYLYDLLHSRSVDDSRADELVSVEKTIMKILCIASLIDYFFFTITLREKLFRILGFSPSIEGTSVHYSSYSSPTTTTSPDYYVNI